MDYLRRLRAEQPAIFWLLLAVGLIVGFQLVLYVVGMILGPLGVPSWVPIAVVVGVLVLIARAQQKSR
jgi:uncharacterized membrane protein YhdT